MPSWDRLTEQEQSDLVEYIKSFSPRFISETPPEALVIRDAPEPTPTMVQDGKAVYALASCWMCHGKTGAGDGPSAAALVDDFERPIPPYNFTRSGAFKGGGTPKDIYRTFSTGIGGTPMPGYWEDALTFAREDFEDLGNLEDQYSKEEISDMRRFVDALPSQERILQMSDADRKALADNMRWALVYYALSLADPNKTQITYTTTDHAILASTVTDLPVAPGAAQWKSINGVELALVSLWQRDTPTDRVIVKSATDGKSIALWLQWDDPTMDDQALYNAKFGDAAAVQFPLDPELEPFFAMGDTNLLVNIWHWKSWWEKDAEAYAGVNSAFPRNATDFYPFDISGGSSAEYFVSVDSAKALSKPWNAGWASGNLLSAQARRSAVEDLTAKGFGTLTSQGERGQNVDGHGVWQDRKWTVVFVRTLTSGGKSDVILERGTTVPVAFAVWDGSSGDRNGQKMVTNWYRLTIGAK